VSCSDQDIPGLSPGKTDAIDARSDPGLVMLDERCLDMNRRKYQEDPKIKARGEERMVAERDVNGG
jgi:hypothetical protein